jgi:hypothetical protein
MTSLVLGDLILKSLTPSMNAPLGYDTVVDEPLLLSYPEVSP